MDRQYLSLSSDLRTLLIQNGISIDDVVKQAGASDLAKTADPAISVSTRSDPATILIASAAVVAVATPLIQRILTTLTHRPIVVKERELVPVLDGKGEVLRDQSGAPILTWRDKQALLQPQASSPDNTKVNVKGFGIEIGLG